MRNQRETWLIEERPKAITPSPGTAMRHGRRESVADVNFVHSSRDHHPWGGSNMLDSRLAATSKHFCSALPNDSIPMARRLSPTRLFPKS